MMIFPSDTIPVPAASLSGGKAHALFRLRHTGLKVPEFVVISAEINEEDINEKMIGDALDLLSPECDFFAVRSSAIGEDGYQDSFAGLFETFLNVPRKEITAYVKKVKASVHSERIRKYTSEKKIALPGKIAVIIQEMVDADSAGVGFGINPVSGTRKEKIISAVYGLGEGLVSGDLAADTWIISDTKTEASIVSKERKLTRNKEGKNEWETIDDDKKNLPSLRDDQLKKTAETLEQLNRHFGKPQDVEFAWKEDQLYILQSRPVTATEKITDKTQSYILWDNSNIIESYPGVTSPLTFSFILSSYEGAYRVFLGYLGTDKKTIEDNAEIFANTLGLINGRVYYNLRNWYRMLALVPGYSLNAEYMEKMMGVKERFDLPLHYKLSKTKAWTRTLRMGFMMMWRYLKIAKTRNKFQTLLDNIIREYRSLDYFSYSPVELMDLYIQFEKKLLNEWKAPLLNDFFAMIAFGRFRKLCGRYGLDPTIYNDLLCGSNDIISTEPIRRTTYIASCISKNEELKKLFTENSGEIILQKIAGPDYSELNEMIRSYIRDFGDRCVGELKLETISYTHDPSLFISILKSYVQSGVCDYQSGAVNETYIREDAEKKALHHIGKNPLKRRKFRRALKSTRDLVSNRENLRYERTRAFGIVREIFLHIGKKLYSENILDSERDIFYLTKEEIFSWINGTSVTQDLKMLVEIRKKEYEKFRSLPVPSERIATYGPVYHANDFFSLDKIEIIEGDLSGTGCCPGKIRGKVRIILDPNSTHSVDGDILVTVSTDPGWVTLFPSCSGLLVERGSLLSHSAIVAREMGIPCIVGVNGLLRNLKNGEEIEMDGSTGIIKRIG